MSGSASLSQATVKAAFAPLIERAEQAGWSREGRRFREVASLGNLYPATFWREFVVMASGLISSYENAIRGLDALTAAAGPEAPSVALLLAELRGLSEELAPYTTSPAVLRENLTGVAALYTDAVALAARFGCVGSA